MNKEHILCLLAARFKHSKRLTRNLCLAFILYRQHRQQEIIRENPGLNNPDISKIIGEQWKAENEDIKKEWQDLAQVSGAVPSLFCLGPATASSTLPY